MSKLSLINGNSEVLDENTSRGLKNSKVIDLIKPFSESKEVELLIVEDRPWGSVANQENELIAKIDTYFSYIFDGFLFQQYPQYESWSPKIKIDSIDTPEGKIKELLIAAKEFAERRGVAFTF